MKLLRDKFKIIVFMVLLVTLVACGSSNDIVNNVSNNNIIVEDTEQSKAVKLTSESTVAVATIEVTEVDEVSTEEVNKQETEELTSEATEAVTEETTTKEAEIEETTERDIRNDQANPDFILTNTDEVVLISLKGSIPDFTQDEKGAYVLTEGIWYNRDNIFYSHMNVVSIIKMMDAKKMPTPYMIEDCQISNISIIYNGNRYRFDSSGNQLFEEGKLEVVEETTAPESTISKVQLFREDYPQLLEWVQRAVDGFVTSTIYIDYYGENDEDGWLFVDRRDRYIYKINYDGRGEPFNVEICGRANPDELPAQ